MLRVQLIVTGQMENRGLARSLRRYFSDRIEFDTHIVEGGFTSTNCDGRILPEPETTRRGDLRLSNDEKLIHALYDLRRNPANHRNRPDFVGPVDDLELANWRHPEKAVEYFLAAIGVHLRRPDRRGRVYDEPELSAIRTILSERCSLHFFCPMPEAYFFAQGPALEAMRSGLARRVHWAGGDPERFEVTDSAYLGTMPDEARRHHPKEYLRHLLQPDALDPYPYKETRHGIAALDALSFQELMQQHGEQARFLRSLLADIGDMAGIDLPPGEAHQVTDHRARRARRILRNM